MKWFGRYVKLGICIFLIASMAFICPNGSYAGDDQSNGLYIVAAIIAVVFVCAAAFLPAAANTVGTLNTVHAITLQQSYYLFAGLFAYMAVELYTGRAVVGIIDNYTDNIDRNDDNRPGDQQNFVRIAVNLSDYNIPMDGNSSIEATLRVMTQAGNIMDLPEGHQIVISHTNLYSMVYDDTGVGLAAVGGGMGGIDVSSGSINVSAAPVVPQGGIVLVNYDTASQMNAVALSVKDSTGKTVYTASESVPDKNNTVPFAWNTRDMSGSRVPAGVYSVAAVASGTSGTQYSNTSFVTVAQNISSTPVALTYSNGRAKAKVISPPPGSTTDTSDTFQAKLVDAFGNTVASTGFVVRYVQSSAAPDPFRSSVIVTPSQVDADGQTDAIVRVTARDSAGNVLASRNVTFSSSRGQRDIFSDTFMITNSQGVAETRVRSGYVGQCQISAMVDNITLTSRALITFAALPPSAKQQAMVNEAARYSNCASWWYFRRSIDDTVGPPPQNKGIIYSFGNKDSIELFNRKLQKSPSAQNWADYLYKTGLFYEEYISGTSPTGYWAGIDCSGLVQRCANIAGYNRIPILQDIIGTEPYHVGNEINNFNSSQYSYLLTSSSNFDPLPIQPGDIVHFPGSPQHWAIVSGTGLTLYDITIIHAYYSNEPFLRKVQETYLYEINRGFNVYRLIP